MRYSHFPNTLAPPSPIPAFGVVDEATYEEAVEDKAVNSAAGDSADSALFFQLSPFEILLSGVFGFEGFE